MFRSASRKEFSLLKQERKKKFSFKLGTRLFLRW
jgi:hypothetical protein